MNERDLGDGLVLRWGRPDDVERQVALTAEVFRQYPGGPSTVEAGPWGRDLGSGVHPHSSIDRLALVEDVHRGIMVACIWLIPMTVSFEGISLQVGRPEHVATHPGYRRRGLIGELFTLIHQRSEADGDFAQLITGIPHFYRQFGYEYALELGGGSIIQGTVAQRAADDGRFRVRRGKPEELSHLRELLEGSQANCLVRNEFSPAYWQWIHEAIRPESGLGWQSLAVVDERDCLVGSVLMQNRRWGRVVDVFGIAAGNHASLHEILPAALRGIDAEARSLPALPLVSMPDYEMLRFRVGSGHPVLPILAHRYDARYQPEDAWLVRTHDLPRLLAKVAPVLEQRIAASALRGYTGHLSCDFYRGGLQILFEDGKLAGFAHGRPASSDADATVGLPPGVILQLVFGRRTLGELRYILPDVWATPSAELLVNVLFPARPSCVLPVS